MRRIIASVFILVCACQNDGGGPSAADPILRTETYSPASENDYNVINWQQYSNKTYNFSIEYPEQWWVAENKAKAGPPVINIYSPAFDDNFELPLTINEDPQVSHVSFFPEGLGSTKPSGTAVGLTEMASPVTFDPDSSESVAYQLNDGEVWGYFLKPDVLPPGWERDGYIFVQINVKYAQVKCFDSSGKEKPVGDCNPIDGGDRIIKYGTVDKTDRNLVNHMLSTLYFADTKENPRPITEMIQLRELTANDSITSPAIIRGNARGPWFVEGRFPIILKDKDHNIVYRTSAVATDSWMTPGLVPFETKINFKSTNSGQGYLVFKQANASGNTEDNRGYILPIILAE